MTKYKLDDYSFTSHDIDSDHNSVAEAIGLDTGEDVLAFINGEWDAIYTLPKEDVRQQLLVYMRDNDISDVSEETEFVDDYIPDIIKSILHDYRIQDRNIVRCFGSENSIVEYLWEVYLSVQDNSSYYE